MYSLFSNPEKRQLKIISHLIDAEGTCSVNYFLREFDISASVLTNDIRELMEKVPQLSIQHVNGQVTLRQFERLNNFIVNKLFMRSLREFELLQLVLEERLDEDGIIEALDISISTLNRMITRLNEGVLKEFNISIQKKPLAMSGQEADIRNFYLSLFNELMIIEDDSLLTMPIDFKVLDDMINYFEVNIDIGSYQTFKLLFYINAVRTANGHKVTYEESKAKELYARLLKPQDLLFLDHVSNLYFNLPCSPARFEQMFFPYAEYFFIPAQQMLQERFEEFPELQVLYAAISKALETLKDKYQLHSEKAFSDIILSVYNSIQLQTYQAKNIYVGYDRAADFAEHIQWQFNPFYLDLFKQFYEVYDLLDTHLPYKTFLDNVIQILFFTWSHLADQLMDPPVYLNVLIISSISTPHAYMIKDFVQRFLPAKSQIDVYDKLELDVQSINKKHYHVVLSSFDIQGLDSAEVIIYDSFPTYRSIHAISEVLEDLNRTDIDHR